MMLSANVRQALDARLEPSSPWNMSGSPVLNADLHPDGRLESPRLSVDVLRRLDDVPLDVALLFASAERQNVESGLAWYRNLVHSVYPDHDGLLIYILRKNGQALALLPALKQGKSGWHCVRSLSNYYTTLYAPFIAPEVTAHELSLLLKTLRDDESPLASMQFASMDPDSRSYQLLLGALKLAGLPAFQFFCFGNWYLPVTIDWSSYLRTREGKLRNTIKRMGKAFAAVGGTLELVTGGAALERGINAYLRVYAASWKQAEPYPDFVPGLIRICAERGWLRLGIAWLNGEAMSAQFWIVANGKASIYKVAYDERHKKYAPGTLLTAMLLQHVFEQDQVAEVDYLIGDDPYKKTWMSHRRERWGIVAYNPKSLLGLFGFSRELLGRAVRAGVLRATARVNPSKRAKPAVAIASTSNWRWRFLPASEFSGVSEQWQTLCDNGSRSPLLSADFVSVALQHFGRGDELICLAETPCGPVAATILQRQNIFVWQTFQPSQMPRGPWLQLLQLDFPTLLQSLLHALPLPSMLIGVTQLDSGLLPRADVKALLTLDSITTGEIAFPATFADYKKSWPSKPHGELMRRMRKGVNEFGPITLTTATEPDAVESFVRLYASMESRSWKAETGTAITQNDEQSGFYVDLLRRFAVTGCARMFTLKMGEHIVAAQIAIIKNDVLYLLKTTYEPELKHLGPGVILKYHMMLDCYDRTPHVERMEFYGPLNESQRMWITGSRAIYHANVYRANLLGQVHSLLRHGLTYKDKS